MKRQPFSGGFVLEDASKSYREVLQGNYRIIYRAAGNTVYIVTARHAARLLSADDLE